MLKQTNGERVRRKAVEMAKSLLLLMHCEKMCTKNKALRQKTAFPILKEGYHVKKEPFTSLSTCRVCLNEGDISIFDKNNSEDIPKALVVFGGIEVNEDDAYPKHLCTSCYEKLQSAISFRKTAQNTDKIFKMSAAKIKQEKNCDNISDGEELDNDAFDFKIPIKKLDEVDHPKRKKKHYYPYCKRCRREFETAEELDEHNLSDEHKTMRQTCTICNKSYRVTYYKRHIELVHTPELPTLVCDICGKTVKGPHKGELQRHRLSHFKELPFQCSQCPYRGRFKISLKIHMRSHTGERPYKCSECSAGFVTKSNLNRHKLTHAPVRNYNCDVCGRGFYTKKTLEMHLKVDHTGVKEHICNICGKEFGYRKQMMKHQLKVHKRQKLKSGKLPLYLQVERKENEELA